MPLLDSHPWPSTSEEYSFKLADRGEHRGEEEKFWRGMSVHYIIRDILCFDWFYC